MYPSFRRSFIEIGEMACIPPARSSHELDLKYTNKMQVETLSHNINTRKACGHDIIIPQLFNGFYVVNRDNGSPLTSKIVWR